VVPVRADIHNAWDPPQVHSGINDNITEARQAQCTWRASLYEDSTCSLPWVSAEHGGRSWAVLEEVHEDPDI
jgi:hypothetical protein